MFASFKQKLLVSYCDRTCFKRDPMFLGGYFLSIVLTGWILINTKKASNNGVSTPAGNPRVLDIKVYEALEKG